MRKRYVAANCFLQFSDSRPIFVKLNCTTAVAPAGSRNSPCYRESSLGFPWLTILLFTVYDSMWLKKTDLWRLRKVFSQFSCLLLIFSRIIKFLVGLNQFDWSLIDNFFLFIKYKFRGHISDGSICKNRAICWIRNWMRNRAKVRNRLRKRNS